MAARLSSYLAFDGTAREALEFYRGVFGGALDLSTFGEYGQEGEYADRIMHGQLDTDAGWTLMASDLTPDMPRDLSHPGRVQLMLHGDDDETLSRWFAALADGGEVITPLEIQSWGDRYGAVRDRFGIEWSCNIAQA